MTRTFAVVYETGTQEIRRLIDTSDDKDDAHLELIRKYLAPDETMEVFRQEDFPHKWPRFVKPFLGQGAVVDKANLEAKIDGSKVADISVASKAYATQLIADEGKLPDYIPKIDPKEAVLEAEAAIK